MSQVEASSSSPAVCRECGATIDPGEPRFGREEGPRERRRTRWRHLACAAQNQPEALLHALELGGWRSVPDEDHDELRALIERAQAERRRGAIDRSEPSGARSHSAMVAAAVLEPAHEAELLGPEQARAWVFADALQARGDVRGELLALELASEHTDDPQQARALQREHRRCWIRFAPALRASKELRLRWVGGFLLGAHSRARRESQRLLASEVVSSLERVRVDFCTQEELDELVAATRDHPLGLVELPNPRVSGLEPLTALGSLRWLKIGGRFDANILARLPALPELRGLAAGLPLDPRALTAVPALEHVELQGVEARALDGLAHTLPRLNTLGLHGVTLERGLAFLAGAEQLRRLDLRDSPLRELGPLPQLPALRELVLVPGNLRLVDELGALTKLERLSLRGSKVGELDALTKLVDCTHLALSGTRTTSLAKLRRLPRLRSLAIESGDMRRFTGLERLAQLEQLQLSKLANLDLAKLAGLDALHTLILAPGGRRPKQLETLAALPRLRRLSAPLELLEGVPRPAALLAKIEVLELDGAATVPASLVAAMPRLRRLLLPGSDPDELERLASTDPELAVFGDAAPRDALARRDPFDWRNVGWGVHAQPITGTR